MPTDYLYKRIFYYVSALAGSGKTYQLIREAYRLVSNGEKVVIVNPSLNLNEQDRKDLKSLDSNLPIRVIDDNNRSSSDNISDQISNFVRNVNPDQGMVLIITHQAFWNIRYWHNQQDWTLLWDEAYDITRHLDDVLDFKHKEEFIFPMIDLIEQDKKYSQLAIRDQTDPDQETLEEKVSSDDCIFRKALLDFNQEFLNCQENLCDIYWNNLFTESNRLVMTSFYKPVLFTGFKKAVFFGALFEKTLMFQHWKQQGIIWEKEESIIHELRHFKHHDPLVIYYAYYQGRHSKNFLNKMVQNKTTLEHFEKKAIWMIDKEDCLHQRNKDGQDYSRDHSNITNVQYNVQGLNDYQDRSILIYSGAFNKQPSFYHLLSHLEYEDFDRAYHLYQNILRTSYRNPDNDKLVKVFIPCLELFDSLKDIFSNVEYVSMGLEEIENQIEDGRKKGFNFDEEVYLNKRSDLVKVFGRRFVDTNKNKISDEFILNGYRLAKVEIRDKWSNRHTKEFWHQTAFPDALLEYCWRKGWKLLEETGS
jgi:hypothetical protein